MRSRIRNLDEKLRVLDRRFRTDEEERAAGPPSDWQGAAEFFAKYPDLAPDTSNSLLISGRGPMTPEVMKQIVDFTERALGDV